MNSCVFTLQSVADLDEIRDFIAAESPAAAHRLVDLLDEKCRRIAQSPEMGRKREELVSALRSFPVGNYVIFYRPVRDGIQVIRILHGARDIETIFE